MAHALHVLIVLTIGTAVSLPCLSHSWQGPSKAEPEESDEYYAQTKPGPRGRGRGRGRGNCAGSCDLDLSMMEAKRVLTVLDACEDH
ncbi:hypothetical protein B0F90DRAFT_819656 [Multifurca ochricompacta]|uniref:Uncharacterized protein n=1 Tax=Multifurca ochricompacta TaxID=376703 RepID=A0AAD4QPE4_9AGAM|nr:hypothetical protein B0F90DRAFT_819656 [Multifurca ochricompacta]